MKMLSGQVASTHKDDYGTLIYHRETELLKGYEIERLGGTMPADRKVRLAKVYQKDVLSQSVINQRYVRHTNNREVLQRKMR